MNCSMFLSTKFNFLVLMLCRYDNFCIQSSKGQVTVGFLFSENSFSFLNQETRTYALYRFRILIQTIRQT